MIFITAAKAATLLDEDALTLRESETVTTNSLLVSETTVAAVVHILDGEPGEKTVFHE
jgi:hypothetical protein